MRTVRSFFIFAWLRSSVGVLDFKNTWYTFLVAELRSLFRSVYQRLSNYILAQINDTLSIYIYILRSARLATAQIMQIIKYKQKKRIHLFVLTIDMLNVIQSMF